VPAATPALLELALSESVSGELHWPPRDAAARFANSEESVGPRDLPRLVGALRRDSELVACVESERQSTIGRNYRVDQRRVQDRVDRGPPRTRPRIVVEGRPVLVGVGKPEGAVNPDGPHATDRVELISDQGEPAVDTTLRHCRFGERKVERTSDRLANPNAVGADHGRAHGLLARFLHHGPQCRISDLRRREALPQLAQSDNARSGRLNRSARRVDVLLVPGDPQAMGLLDEITRQVGALPSDAHTLTERDWLRTSVALRLLSTELREATSALARFGHVNEHSRSIEKEWYKAALDRADELVSAFGVFDAWWRSARMASVNKELDATYAGARRPVRYLRGVLSRVGDPTAPGWRPPLADRLAARVRAHDSSRSSI
jgi:hypothetical protein